MVQGAAAERRRRSAQSSSLFLPELAQRKLHLSLALDAQWGHALQRHVRPASGVVEGEGCPAAGAGRMGVGCTRVHAEQARAVEDVAALQHARHVERLEADAALLGGGGARPWPLDRFGRRRHFSQAKKARGRRRWMDSRENSPWTARGVGGGRNSAALS